MTNAIVTGGNGQLATCIKDIENDYSNLNIIYTDYLDLDICDLNQVKAFFSNNQNISYCINCAAYTAVDKAEVEVDKAYEINLKGVKNLALVCLENNVTLIQISTDFVFEGNKTIPYKEDEEMKPLSIFEESNIKIKLNSIKTDAYQIPVKHPVYSVIDKDKIKRELKNETPSQKDSISKDYE